MQCTLAFVTTNFVTECLPKVGTFMRVILYESIMSEGGIEKSVPRITKLLAPRGLPRDGNLCSRGMDFSIPSSHKLWILFLAQHLILHLYWKKLEKDFKKILNMLRCDMVTSGIDVRSSCGCSFFIFP